MNKLLTSIIIVGLMLYFPLWNRFDLMLNIKLIFPVIVSLWLLLKQKTLDLKKIKENVATDKYSTLMIVFAGMFSQAFPVFIWKFTASSCEGCLTLPYCIGIVMLFGGLYLRLIAIETLDKYFTNEVLVGEGWKLIQRGVYKYLRHPSYTGGLISMLGTSVLLESYLCLFINTIVLLSVYFFRIYLEEKELIRHFREDYIAYKDRTYALLPFLY